MIKNIELLQCAVNAAEHQDIQWFEIYGNVIKENLTFVGNKVFEEIKKTIGDVQTKTEIDYVIWNIKELSEEERDKILDYIPESSINFFLKKIKEDMDKSKAMSIMRRAINGSIEVENAYSELKTLISGIGDVSEKCYISAEDILDSSTGDVEWLVDGYIPKGGLVMFAGEPKHGKSMFSLDLALRLTEGNDRWLNELHINKCKVVYIDAENADVLIKKRMSVLGATKRCKDLNFITKETLGVSRIDMTNMNVVLKIKKALLKLNIGKDDLVVFDSFRRLFSGNENDSNVIAEVMANINGINLCSKLVLHHLRKKGNEPSSETDRVRGSGDITASVDGLISIVTDGNRESRTTSLNLSLVRWDSGAPSMTIKWSDMSGRLIFVPLTSLNQAANSMKAIRSVVDYLKKSFESRTMFEITNATGLPETDASHALATLIREEKIKPSSYEGKKYYGLKKT